MKTCIHAIVLLFVVATLAACGGDDANSDNSTTANNGADSGNSTTNNGGIDAGCEPNCVVPSVVGNECSEGCGEGFCLTTDDDEYCSVSCDADTDCPDEYACIESGDAERPSVCAIDGSITVNVFSYIRPRNETVLDVDRTEIALMWTGGEAPYSVEFGDSEANLTEVGQIMGNEFVLNVGDQNIVDGGTYSWRVTSAAGGAEAEIGPVWTFQTVAIDLPACATAEVTQGQRTFGTVQVGTTCWLDGNLTVGLESGGRTVNDEVIERLCPIGGCENSAYYTGWELYQFYNEDPADLAEAAPVLCPEGWRLPTQTQVDELATTLTSDQLAAFFPQESSRAPINPRLENCIVTGEFELCTTFLDPETDENISVLWMDGTPTGDGLEYFVIENNGGTWGATYDRISPSHGLNVRCVEAGI